MGEHLKRCANLNTLGAFYEYQHYRYYRAATTLRLVRARGYFN